MSLLASLFGFFIIKGILQLPFYFKRWQVFLGFNLFVCMAVVPFITLLYHETQINFSLVFVCMFLVDAFLLYYIVQPTLWKAITASLIGNLIAILFFILGNG